MKSVPVLSIPAQQAATASPDSQLAIVRRMLAQLIAMAGEAEIQRPAARNLLMDNEASALPARESRLVRRAADAID